MKKITVKIKESTQKQFKFSGIASSEVRDRDGEIIRQSGIDLTLVPLEKVIVNAEHEGPTLGKVTYAEIKNGQLYIEGFVEVTAIKAKKIFELLRKEDPSQNLKSISNTIRG